LPGPRGLRFVRAFGCFTAVIAKSAPHWRLASACHFVTREPPWTFAKVGT